ncbi:hypothetical protein [Nesterenkonia pannonica]|nr:hypothetical protein [Nesterenkonia pannonica]
MTDHILQMRSITKRFGGVTALSEVSCRWPVERSTPSAGRTGRASPP